MLLKWFHYQGGLHWVYKLLNLCESSERFALPFPRTKLICFKKLQNIVSFNDSTEGKFEKIEEKIVFKWMGVGQKYLVLVLHSLFGDGRQV